jgi:S1-C subfamily serine protease
LFFQRSGSPTLIVARARGAGRAAGLGRGDRILALDGVSLEHGDEAQLMKALRGRSGEATLSVQSASGETRDVRIALSPREDPLARRGVLIDGALFAASNHADIDTLADAPKLMVHFVAPGSLAERQGLEPYDHIVSVDGEPVQTAEELLELLRAERAHAQASLEMLRFVEVEDRFTEYVIARLPGRSSQWISARPQSAEKWRSPAPLNTLAR